MSEEFIKLDMEQMFRAISEMDRKYSEIEKQLRNDIAKRVLKNAGQIFLNEQRRILAQKSPKLASKLELWITGSSHGWHLNVGFPAKIFKVTSHMGKDGKPKQVKENVEAFIIEYGRPGAKGMKKGGIDTIKRKIGRVESHSYIRASKFLKGEEVMKEIEKELEEEIKRLWNA